MEKSIRDFQFIIYAALFVISMAVLVIVSNQLIFHNSFLNDAQFNVGDWVYWIFAVSFIAAIMFGYSMWANLRDTSRFESLINSSSKSVFVRNLDELERLAKKLGKGYLIQLENAKEKWKVK
ncbi:TVG0404408 [Thermoplasma volcanium GSS1]|uniref:TVG0404408 protein n=1 Tax=Thermoplasma volcanium (strain ATCC 51530 / DSM 4299 / JCM 9571 / NBRC 15438 / GSS1) TaxID=273116 RepID=Q97BN8_THEVO|nr:DUF3198 domain-containing protein [Thermoplasma volcanium]BAB59559.1 TVG0404408 [Thermoplasma volcanium GSS1]